MFDQIIEPLNHPQQAIIFLHGYGADGNNLLSMHNYFEDGENNTLYCAPNAPTPCEEGPTGWQWFSLVDYTPEILSNEPHGNSSHLKRYSEKAQDVAPYLIKYIHDLKQKYNLRDNQISLIGFSQGAMMALYLALNHLPKLRAVIAYSGALLSIPQLKLSTSLLLLVHGDQDTIVPVKASLKAYQDLRAADYDVKIITIPGLGHSIDQLGIQAAHDFLQNCRTRETIK